MEFAITLFLYINAICNPNYFMDSENKAVSEKEDDFGTLETFKIHKTRYSAVFAVLVTIKEKLYGGLQRKCYFQSLSQPKTKSIYLPLEAWATLQTQAAQSIEKAIKAHRVTPPARTEAYNGKKRAYNYGIILIHSQIFLILNLQIMFIFIF